MFTQVGQVGWQLLVGVVIVLVTVAELVVLLEIAGMDLPLDGSVQPLWICGLEQKGRAVFLFQLGQ